MTDVAPTRVWQEESLLVEPEPELDRVDRALDRVSERKAAHVDAKIRLGRAWQVIQEAKDIEAKAKTQLQHAEEELEAAMSEQINIQEGSL